MSVQEKGNLSVNSENILPIIKKWLYSDTDIFMRELISNGTDAISKLKKLIDLGEAKNVPADETYRIDIILNKEDKTIKFIDNGIGMTAEEIKEYINQIAFSGASAFVEKYNDKIGKDNDIIGHFGLGFYSAFMVAETVTIDTLSYKEGATPCKWKSDGGVEFEISESDRITRGTEITLHIAEGEEDFLEEFKLRSIIRKYCGFMPVDIFFDNGEPAPVNDDDEIEVEEEKPINDSTPLWLKKPNECTDDEYKDFYRTLFNDFNEPLFWIHLNMDYPFNLKGILYFPKLNHELESIEGEVKLYNNQVFIADNVKEVLPEFLLLLKGAIDCPDLPLNVSRSFLQNDREVSKMSSYIIKKVADKLNSIFKSDREQFNSYWEDISPFIKYGCIKDENFYKKVSGSILFKDLNQEYLTLEEYLEKTKDTTKDKIYYVTNKQQQAQYIKMFKDNGMNAVILTTNLDNPFVTYLENYETDRKISFSRIDAEITESMKNETEVNEDDKKSLEEIFKNALGLENLKIQIEELKTANIPAIILLSEEERRMQEMMKMFGNNPSMAGMFNGGQETLLLNKNNSLINMLLENKDNEDKNENIKLVCQQIYDLAMLSHKPLTADTMNEFMERSYKVFEKLM